MSVLLSTAAVILQPVVDLDVSLSCCWHNAEMRFTSSHVSLRFQSILVTVRWAAGRLFTSSSSFSTDIILPLSPLVCPTPVTHITSTPLPFSSPSSLPLLFSLPPFLLLSPNFFHFLFLSSLFLLPFLLSFSQSSPLSSFIPLFHPPSPVLVSPFSIFLPFLSSSHVLPLLFSFPHFLASANPLLFSSPLLLSPIFPSWLASLPATSLLFPSPFSHLLFLLLSSFPHSDQREKERETRLQELRQQREERSQKGRSGAGAGEVVMRKVEKSADGSSLSQVTKTNRFAQSGIYFCCFFCFVFL